VIHKIHDYLTSVVSGDWQQAKGLHSTKLHPGFVVSGHFSAVFEHVWFSQHLNED
jgi:hypothetical protein